MVNDMTDTPSPSVAPKTRKKPRQIWQDPNSIYWLEIRQARRNYVFYILLALGVLAGVYLITLFSMGDEDTVWNELPLLAFPLVIYSLGPLAIPLYCGSKLASQQRHGDLIMETPFPSGTILWGKLQVVLTLTILLYAPSIPGAFLLCFQEKLYFVLFVLFLPFATISTAMMLLGFMSGAKNTPLTIAMVALFFLFFTINLLVTCFSIAMFFNPFFFLSPGFYTLMYIDDEDFIRAFLGFSSAVVFNLFPSLLIFLMGIRIFGRNKDLLSALNLPLVFLFLFSPFFLLVCFALELGGAVQVGLILLVLAYFGSPSLAVYLIYRNNISQRNILDLESDGTRGFLSRLRKRRKGTPSAGANPQELESETVHE